MTRETIEAVELVVSVPVADVRNVVRAWNTMRTPNEEKRAIEAAADLLSRLAKGPRHLRRAGTSA